MCYSPATAWFSGVHIPGRGEVPVCATALLQPGSQACRSRAGAGVPPTINPVRGGICFNGKFDFEVNFFPARHIPNAAFKLVSMMNNITTRHIT